MRVILNHWISLLLLVIVVLVIFYQLPQGYFEQDEWHSFGHYLYLQSLPPVDFISHAFPGGKLGHFTPLALITKMSLFNIFGLQAQYFFLISILWHAVIVVVVYYLFYLLFQQKLLALFGALFFAVNSSHYQAVTWLGTFEGTEGATLMGTLSLLTMIVYQKTSQIKYYRLTLVLLFLGLLFKEIALTYALVVAGLIILRPLPISRLKLLAQLVLVVGGYLILRFLVAFVSVANQPGPINAGGSNLFDLVIYNLVVIPPKLIIQILLPPGILVTITQLLASKINMLLEWLGIFETVSSSSAAIILAGSLILVVASISLWRNQQGRLQIYPLILGGLIVIATAVPLLLLKQFSQLLDSRYLYPATLGIGLIIATLIESFWSRSFLVRAVLATVGLILIVAHATALYAVVGDLVKDGHERKEILKQTSQIQPSLKRQTVILAESDRPYYGLTERIFPFQSGLGQLLLVYYQQSQAIPATFFTSEFLWNILDQGYQEIDGFGFGFFWDLKKLAETIEENNLPTETILALAYDSQNQQVVDISQRVRGELEGIQSAKRPVDLSSARVTASHNSAEAFLAIDNNRGTSWSSKTPYYLPQSLTVDLGRQIKVAQLRIDSADNKDQNEVGYQLFVSDDGENFREVFWDKRRSPWQDGLVEIYLPKISAKAIRIDQIGFHRYAPWVIHELRVYEAVD